MLSPAPTGAAVAAVWPAEDLVLVRLRDYLVYLVVRVFVCVIQALPLDTCHSLARGLAWLVCTVLQVRHTVVEENLRHAFPEMSRAQRRRVERGMWEHLVLMLAEMAHAPRKIHETNWRDYIEFRDGDVLSRALFDDRPAVVVSGHFGNFELGGYIFGLFGFPTFTVARPLDNPYLDRFLLRFRGAKGQVVLPKSGSAQMAEQLLSTGGTLSILGDQNAGPYGCFVEFFGRPASTHKAIAVFSLANSAPLAVSYSCRLDRPLRYEMGVEAAVDPLTPGAPTGSVTELTQWFTRKLEDAVRRRPEQYWWLHRRWKDQPGARKRKRKQAA